MKKGSRGRKSGAKINLKPIVEIARSIGIRKQYVEPLGLYKGKISTDILKSLKKKQAKYILVSSITPTPLGEGKTVTAIGLSMAFKKLKKKAIPCIPQASLSSFLSTRGNVTGGGFARILPKEDISLHLTGDNHAVACAHNLCVSYIDNSIYNGNPLDIDPSSITWKRVVETKDRSLRNVNTGLGGKNDGIPRKTGFTLVPSSELVGILSLASSLKDLRERIGKIIIGFTTKGKPVTCEAIKVAGSMAVLLKDALKPNIVQTLDSTACFVHAPASTVGSIGTSSVIADKIALGLSDYAISETEFGADIGVEKFLDVKCRIAGLKPDVAVLVCSVRALKMHSGDFDIIDAKLPREIYRESISAVERGLPNLEKQIENIKVFGIPVVVCINRFVEDTDKEIHAVERRIMGFGADSVVVSTVYAEGTEGAIPLAKAIILACKSKVAFRFLYPLDIPIKDKIRRIAKSLYGAKDVNFSDEVSKKVSMLKKLKINNLPIVMVKTTSSLSHNPKRKGRPHGFKFPVEDITICQGAGYITALAANVREMPDLPFVPLGAKLDLNEEGKIVGL